MDEQIPRPRQTQFTRATRAKRILKRLREGWAYDEVAREERLTERRVRQIVTQFLHERETVSDAPHANMQIDRLGRAMRVAGDALGERRHPGDLPVRLGNRPAHPMARGAFAAGKGRLRIFRAVEAP